MRTPLRNAVLQSDIDFNGHRAINTDGVTLPGGWVSALDHGARADGVTDDTVAVQNAIAAAESVVYFPPGNYYFAGTLGLIPPNVSLVGANQFGPNETLNQPEDNQQHTLPTAGGTCFLVTANAGNAVGTPFISLSDMCSVRGITFYWPNQSASSSSPTAYPWAIYIGQTALASNGRGLCNSVVYCNLVNAYQGIYIENAVATLIEEIRGTALLVGIKMEGNYSVTRLRGCYFDVGWCGGFNGTILPWIKANAVAYAFGRNDLTIVDNCFALEHKAWLHFYQDDAHNIYGPNASWVQVRGGGGDICTIPVWIEQTQAVGVDIDGATITIENGTTNVPIVVAAGHNGATRIRNCTIVGWAGKFATVAGTGIVTVDNCFCIGDANAGITPTVFATTGWAVTGTGNFALRGCTFKTTQTHLNLAATLSKAIVTGNMNSGTFNVTNGMGAAAVIANNTA